MGQQAEANPTDNIYIPIANKLVGNNVNGSGSGNTSTGGTKNGFGGDT